MLKSNKGYSLTEIAVGMLILTVFLFFSIGLFNACYTNYRRIKQRNIAIDRAIYYMENMLQTDSNVLTGYYVQTLDPATNKYSLAPNPTFLEFIRTHFEDFAQEYAKYKGIEVADVGTPTLEELSEFINNSKDVLINAYIKYDAKNNASVAQLQNGTYGFLTESGRFTGDTYEIVVENEQLNSAPGGTTFNFATSNGGAYRLKKTISRIPSTNGNAYGNALLQLRVDVYYSYDFSRVLTEDNMQVITLKTIKL